MGKQGVKIGPSLPRSDVRERLIITLLPLAKSDALRGERAPSGQE